MLILPWVREKFTVKITVSELMDVIYTVNSEHKYRYFNFKIARFCGADHVGHHNHGVPYHDAKYTAVQMQP